MPISKQIEMAEEDGDAQVVDSYFEKKDASDNERDNKEEGEQKEVPEKPREKVDAVNKDAIGVPVENVLTHLKYRTHSAQLCFDFMVYIPFLIMFIFFFLHGRDVTENYYVVRVMKDKLMGNELPTEHIDKYFVDIANAYDWGRWAAFVMVPNLWDCSRATDSVQQLIAQGQNYLLGSLRIRTHRVTNTSCDMNEHMFAEDYGECYGTWAGGDQETEDRFSVPNPLHHPNLELVTTDTARLSYTMNWPVTTAALSNLTFMFNGTGVSPFNTTVEGDLRSFRRYTVRYPSPMRIDAYSVGPVERALGTPTAWSVTGLFEGTWTDIDSQEDMLDRVTISLNSTVTVSEVTFTADSIVADAVVDSPEKPFLYKHQGCRLPGLHGYIYGDVSVYHCGGYVVDIPFRASCGAVRDTVRVLQSDTAPFYDNYATRFLAVEYFVYSVQMNTFTSVKMYNEQAACGSWVNKWHIRTFGVYTNEPPVLFVFFFIFVCYYCWRFVADWRAYYLGYPPGTRETKGRFLAFILEFWNILELANLVTFIVVFAVEIVWMVESNKAALEFPFPDKYPKDLDYLLELYMTKVYANAVNTIITFLKFLKYVRLNSRLNVLSATIALKSGDMIACLIIFVYIVFAYSLTANALFGSGLSGYRTIGEAYSTLTRMLLGDFDYNSLKRENMYLAAFFFWSFVVIGLFLLLNFLIAILSEGFAQVSDKSTEVPLDEQLTRSWAMLKRMLRPARLLNGAKMWAKGHSRHTLLIRACIKMEDYQTLIESVDVPGDDSDTRNLIYRTELPVFMGTQEYELLGREYLDDVWDDILYDWELAQKNSQEQQDTENVNHVRKSITGVCDNELNDIDNMWHKMQQLHEELNNLYSVLQTSF